MTIPLKANKNKASKEQLDFIDFLNKQSYYACVCWGSESAIEIITEYLENKL